MFTKKEAIEDPNSVLNKCADDEVIFVLRARDLTAAGLVYQWANRAEKHGCPKAKCDEARAIADAMELWPSRKYPS